MKKTLIALAAFGILGLSSVAFAQTIDFTAVDADANGAVSFAEAQAVWPDLTQEAFNAADVDASGELSPAELATLPAPAPAP